jgi:hypothetical protein
MLKSSAVVQIWIGLAALSVSALNTQDDSNPLRRRTQASPLTGVREFLYNIWPTSFLDCFNGGDDVVIISNFTIDLDLKNVPNDKEFKRASASWSSVIVGDVRNFTGTLGGQSDCGLWPSQIDDVYICGQYRDIDGPGNVLGSAGPRHYRPTEKIPLTGVMSFDAVDIRDGRIQDMFGVIVSATLASGRVVLAGTGVYDNNFLTITTLQYDFHSSMKWHTW